MVKSLKGTQLVSAPWLSTETHHDRACSPSLLAFPEQERASGCIMFNEKKGREGGWREGLRCLP